MRDVTKADFQAVLVELGIRTDWTKDEEKVAAEAAIPTGWVAQAEAIRKKYSPSAFKRLHSFDQDKDKYNRLQSQIKIAKRTNRVGCSLTILRALQTIFKTLPKGSEVAIGLDWSLRYPFLIRWKPKGMWFWSGTMRLNYQQEWLDPYLATRGGDSVEPNHDDGRRWRPAEDRLRMLSLRTAGA